LSELVTLAADFVRLSSEIEDVRRRMLSALSNGAGAEPPVRPTPAARSGVKKGPQPKHPKVAEAAKAEAEIISLLRSTPGLKSAEIAKQTKAKRNTTSQRLERMMARGQVQRGDQGAYAASPG
jgi:Winged helix-turn-helix DNA-binding